MSNSFRPKTRRIDLSDAFGPESRSFNVFRRVYTTSLVTSLVFLLVLIAVDHCGPLKRVMSSEWQFRISFSLSACISLIHALLMVTGGIALLVCERARFVLAFWIGLVVSPLGLLMLIQPRLY